MVRRIKRANLIIFVKTPRNSGGRIFTNKMKAKKFFFRKKKEGFAVRNRSISVSTARQLKKLKGIR